MKSLIRVSISAGRLINHHSARHLASNIRRQFRRLLFFAAGFSLVDMRFQSLVEIVRAHAGIDDGQNNENEGDDGEERQ